jgi:hypothetical protein
MSDQITSGTASPGTNDMASIVASAVAEATATTIREQPRDEQGRFVSPDADALAPLPTANQTELRRCGRYGFALSHFSPF